MAIGETLRDDAELRDKVDGWIIRGAQHLVTQYGSEATTIITDTIERWDADEASRRIRLHVGRDLSSFASTARWWVPWPVWSSTQWLNCCSDLRLVLTIVSTGAYSVLCMQNALVLAKDLTMAQDEDLSAVAGSELAAVVSNAAQDIGSFIRSHREAAEVRSGSWPSGPE